VGDNAENLAARWATFWDADTAEPDSGLYAEAAQIEDGQRGPSSRKVGRENVLEWRQGMLREIPDQRVTIARVVECGEWRVAEFVVQGTSAGDSCRQAYPGVVWLRVDADGRIASQCSYFEWSKRRPDHASSAGRVYAGEGRQRTQAWYRSFADRLAELWSSDYVRMCHELYAEHQTLDLMGGGPQGIQRSRAQLLDAEKGLHARIPVRKMTVLDLIGERGLLAFTHVIVSARSWDRPLRYWPVCLVLTLDDDDMVISDHSHVMNARPGPIPTELAPQPENGGG
jgi:hypothetical protein